MIKPASLCTLLLLAGCGTHPDPGHFLFGAYPGSGQTLQSFETLIGHPILLVEHYQNFSTPLPPSVASEIGAGKVPFIVWTSSIQGGSVTATDILAGKYDQTLIADADAIAALGGTVMVEWQPEMTDNVRMPLFFAGVPLANQGSTYVAVWLYIHNIFVAQGATNAKWVWSPDGGAYETKWHGIIRCLPYFPGASYVDWMGVHRYNKSDTPAAYDSDPALAAFYAVAQQLAPGLPLIHSQTGATSLTDAQREWIATAESSLQTKWPLVRGFLYFNENGKNPSQGQSELYALSGQGLAAFQTMAADPYFQ